MFHHVLVAALAAVPLLPAQTFQLVMCETPVGSGSGQPIERFLVAGTNGALTRISDIPAAATNDPVALAFDNQYELFVSNRAGHSGNSSISRFRFDPAFGVFTPNGTITGNGVADTVQLAFNPIDGELFVGNWTGGRVARFLFGPTGNAIANGTLTMPDGSPQLGVAVRAADQQLFVSSYGFVRRFRRQAGGAYTHVGNFTIPGASNIHFMSFRGDELFVADVSTNAVHRFRFNAGGDPVPNGSVPTTSAIGVAFSPDGNEMFVARHFAGGFQRLLYQPATDTWTPTTVQAGPQAGGIATTVHTFSSYGTGCAGTGGAVPTLSGYGFARPGNTVILRTQLGLPSSLGTVVLAMAPGNTPLLGCTWWQSIILGNTNLFQLDATGRYDLSIPVPAGLAPIDVYFQSFVLDAGAANGLFSTTAGLRASPL